MGSGSGWAEAWTLGERSQWVGSHADTAKTAAVPGSWGRGCRAPGLRVGWEAATRKRNSLGEPEADAEVILADTVIAAILLKGKLQKKNRI